MDGDDSEPLKPSGRSFNTPKQYKGKIRKNEQLSKVYEILVWFFAFFKFTFNLLS